MILFVANSTFLMTKNLIQPNHLAKSNYCYFAHVSEQTRYAFVNAFSLFSFLGRACTATRNIFLGNATLHTFLLALIFGVRADVRDSQTLSEALFLVVLALGE